MQIFHLYKGFHRKFTKIGHFVKGSARVVQPPRIEYKGFKFKFNKKGDICRGLIIRTNFNIKNTDGAITRFYKNNLISLKKKQELKSKYLFGPISRSMRRKKFTLLFKAVF
jgi:ribosomal protein L14